MRQVTNLTGVNANQRKVPEVDIWISLALVVVGPEWIALLNPHWSAWSSTCCGTMH